MEIWFSGNILKRINMVKSVAESLPDFVRRATEEKVLELEKEELNNGRREKRKY